MKNEAIFLPWHQTYTHNVNNRDIYRERDTNSPRWATHPQKIEVCWIKIAFRHIPNRFIQSLRNHHTFTFQNTSLAHPLFSYLSVAFGLVFFFFSFSTSNRSLIHENVINSTQIYKLIFDCSFLFVISCNFTPHCVWTVVMARHFRQIVRRKWKNYVGNIYALLNKMNRKKAETSIMSTAYILNEPNKILIKYVMSI